MCTNEGVFFNLYFMYWRFILNTINIMYVLYIEQMRHESSKLWILNAEVKVYSTNKHTVDPTVRMLSKTLTHTV